jgi:hypothetical protein
MEGLRVLPGYQDARRKDPKLLNGSCENCIATVDPLERQRGACGFLPETEGAYPWHPQSMIGTGITLTTCPAYTVDLPEVMDIARGRVWFDKGCLETRLGPDMEPSIALLDGIEVLEASVAEFRDWRTDHPDSDQQAQPPKAPPRQTPREPSRMRTPQEREAVMAKRKERK